MDQNRHSHLDGNLLPEGWAETTLSDVVAINPKNVDVPPQPSGFIPMALAPTDFKGNLEFEERDWDEIKKKYTHFANGDVIFAKVTPCFENGKAAIVTGLPNGIGAGSSEFYVLRPLNEDVLASYIFANIKGHQFMQNGAENMTGAVGLRRVPRKFVENFKIQLPPLAEQKVIADKLDTLLAQVETTKARLDRIPQILKTFRQSVLSAAVSGKLTEEWRGQSPERSIVEYLDRAHEEREKLKGLKKLKKSFGPKKSPDPLFTSMPEGWEWVSFEHIAENDNNALKAGPFGSALRKSDCIESGYKVYGQEQVIAGNEQLATYYVNDEKFQQLLSCYVKPGDILISLVGTIGKVLILSDSAEQGIINPRLVKLSLHEDISRSFIKLYLNSPIAIGFFKGFSHGGTMDILNLGILKELPIALPPLEEQTEIARRVDELFAFADITEQKTNAALERVNNLTQSILAKAFRGELTERWRATHLDVISGENSAKALLEKIKAEREKLSKKPKKKK